MQPPDYPIHWIFDYFPHFTADEQAIALLLFEGKTLRETAFRLDLKAETVEKARKAIAKKTHLGWQMTRASIENRNFFRKWGFIRKKK